MTRHPTRTPYPPLIAERRRDGWAQVALELIRSERALCGAALLVSLLTAGLFTLHMVGALHELRGLATTEAEILPGATPAP